MAQDPDAEIRAILGQVTPDDEIRSILGDVVPDDAPSAEESLAAGILGPQGPGRGSDSRALPSDFGDVNLGEISAVDQAAFSLFRGMGRTGSGLVQGLTMLPQLQEEITGVPTPLDFLFGDSLESAQEGWRKVSEEMVAAYDGKFPTDNTFLNWFSEGLGSALAFLGVGALTGGGGLTGTLGIAAAGASVNGADAYYDMLSASGGDESKAWQAFLVNAGVGTTEAISLSRILGRIGAPARNALVDAIIEAGEEGVQEAVQSGVQDLFVEYMTDEDRDVVLGMARGGGMGILTGGVLSGAASLARGPELTQDEIGRMAATQDAEGAPEVAPPEAQVSQPSDSQPTASEAEPALVEGTETQEAVVEEPAPESPEAFRERMSSPLHTEDQVVAGATAAGLAPDEALFVSQLSEARAAASGSDYASFAQRGSQGVQGDVDPELAQEGGDPRSQEPVVATDKLQMESAVISQAFTQETGAKAMEALQPLIEQDGVGPEGQAKWLEAVWPVVRAQMKGKIPQATQRFFDARVDPTLAVSQAQSEEELVEGLKVAKKQIRRQAGQSAAVRAEATEAMGEDLAKRLLDELKAAVPLRLETEIARSEERARRSAGMARIAETTQGRAVMGELRKMASGVYPKFSLEPLGSKFTEAEIDALFDHLRTHPKILPFERLRLGAALEAILDQGGLPTPSDLGLFRKVFGPDVAGAMLTKIPDRRSASWDKFVEFMLAAKAVQATFDLSASLRQGILLGVMHPETYGQAFVRQVGAFASERYAMAAQKAIQDDPNYLRATRAGVQLTTIDPRGTTEERLLEQREEFFIGRMLQRLARMDTSGPRAVLLPLKALGKSVRASERAWATFLNQLRFNVFNYWADRAEASLDDPNAVAHAQVQIARMVNALSGRSNLDPNIVRSDVAQVLLFSPSFTLSRAEAPARIIKGIVSRDPVVRRMSLRALTSSAVFYATLAMMWNLMFGDEEDWEFTLDPRHTDFLKIRMDDTRVDMGGGEAQMLRLWARLLTDTSINSNGVESEPSFNDLGRFLVYKMSPGASHAVQAAIGEDVLGREVSKAQVAGSLVTPISLKSIQEILDEHSAVGAASLIAAEFLGAGVQVYD